MLKQILIADDSSAVRRIVRILLAGRADVEVCGEAVNGLEAVEKAKALKPDLILLDLLMPEMNGAEAASILKKTMPELPIVLFTMHGDNIGTYLTSAIGVDAVLSKPDGASLVKVIDAVLTPGSGLFQMKKPYVKPSVTTRPLVDELD